LFESRQRRITVGNEHDYMDLVFYHRHLRCHVLLDPKSKLANGVKLSYVDLKAVVGSGLFSFGYTEKSLLNHP
jgi:hypothetical protein